MRELSEESEGRKTTVSCTTTASPDSFTIEVHHDWSPLGAQRFVDLVKDGFFTDVALFRCVKNFLVQFGVAPDPNSPKKQYWRSQGAIEDDPNIGMKFKRGMVSFAGGGKNTRTTQLFITYSDLKHLGKPESPWETPLGEVTEGMESVVDKFFQGYGDQFPFNKDGINQSTLQQRGNVYLRENFPEISYFKECHVVSESGPDDARRPVVQEKAQAKPNDGENDDGLWVASEDGGDAKQGSEEWVAHAEWNHEVSRLQRHEQIVPHLEDLNSLSDAEAVKIDRVEEVDGVSTTATAFLLLALIAVLMIWSKTRKTPRRTR